MTDFEFNEVDPRQMRGAIAKWDATVLKYGFVPFPKLLLQHMHRIFTGKIGMKHLAAVLAVADFKRANLKWQPSVEYLAFVAGLEPEELQGCFRDLKRRKLITIEYDDESSYGPTVEVDLSPLEQRIADLAGERT